MVDDCDGCFFLGSLFSSAIHKHVANVSIYSASFSPAADPMAWDPLEPTVQENDQQ
jgi:hypothetical protein